MIREEDEKRELKQQQKTTNQNSSGCTINRRDCVYDIVPFSSGTSDAGIKAEPSRLSAVIAPIPTVHVVPLISSPYIPSILHSERIYGMTSNGIAMPFEVVRTHNS